MQELKPSRLFTFLDKKENFALTFLEGQRLIMDLAILHGYQASELSFVRDAVLSAEHLVHFSRNNESLGFYFDSEVPSFVFKLESNPQGFVRTLKLPEDANPLPKKFSGLVRLISVQPNQKNPYESVIRVDGKTIEAMVDAILQQSFQVDGQVLLAAEVDQSLMVSSHQGLTEEESFTSAAAYLLKHKKKLLKVFAKQLNDEKTIISTFEKLGYRHLQNTLVQLHCPCSKDTLVSGLRVLIEHELKEAAKAGNDHIQVRCQYCKKEYHITLEDLA